MWVESSYSLLTSKLYRRPSPQRKNDDQMRYKLYSKHVKTNTNFIDSGLLLELKFLIFNLNGNSV